jgi:hypothetical protein
MLKEFIVYLVKAVAALMVLVGVWAASGEYQRRNFRQDFDASIQVRVRAECLRPEWVKSKEDAHEYDLTVREMDLLANKMDLINRRTTALLDNAERVEALRVEMTAQSKVPLSGGIGGPAPRTKKK